MIAAEIYVGGNRLDGVFLPYKDENKDEKSNQAIIHEYKYISSGGGNVIKARYGALEQMYTQGYMRIPIEANNPTIAEYYDENVANIKEVVLRPIVFYDTNGKGNILINAPYEIVHLIDRAKEFHWFFSLSIVKS